MTTPSFVACHFAVPPVLTPDVCIFLVEFHPYFLNSDDLEELRTNESFERISKSVAALASLNAHRLVAFAKQHAFDRQSEVRNTV